MTYAVVLEAQLKVGIVPGREISVVIRRFQKVTPHLHSEELVQATGHTLDFERMFRVRNSS